MDAVELEQVRGRRRAALQLVDMDDIEPVGGAGVAVRPAHRAEGGAKRQPADPPHAVDADAHDALAATYKPVR